MQLLTAMTTTVDDDVMSASGLVDRSTAAADDVALWTDAQSCPSMSSPAQASMLAADRRQVA